MAGNTSPPGASVTSRAFAVLDAFGTQRRRATLTELAAAAGLPLSTAHRIVGELTVLGALTRLPDGAYVIGRRLWSLGLLAPVQAGLREAAAPFLHDLHTATGATVHLAVRDGDQVLYLDRISGSRSVPVVSSVGSRLPLHATGVGKVLLAHAPLAVQSRILANLGRVTPYTITQPGRLRRQLDRVRVDGFATTAEEMTLGACSVAVPVQRGDDVAAALGLVVAALGRDRPRHVAALTVAAHGIARVLADEPQDRLGD